MYLSTYLSVCLFVCLVVLEIQPMDVVPLSYIYSLFYFDKVMLNRPGLSQTFDPLVSTSKVAEIINMCHCAWLI